MTTPGSVSRRCRALWWFRQSTAALALLLAIHPGSSAAADMGAGLLWKKCTGSDLRACQLFVAEVADGLGWPKMAMGTLPWGVVEHFCPHPENHDSYWETYVKIFIEYWGSAPDDTWSSARDAVVEALEDTFPECASQRTH